MTERDDRERHQRRAHRAVAAAVEAGLLVPSEDCENCGRIPGPGDPKLNAHHWLGYEPEVVYVVEWLCKGCHLAAHPEVARAGAVAAWQGRSPEERSRILNTSSEEQARRAQAMWDRRTPEQRAAWAQRVNATLGPEGRRERARRAHAALTPEQRSERSRTGKANLTPAQRSEKNRKGALTRWAKLTPEERSAIARKAAATRRAKYGPTGRGT